MTDRPRVLYVGAGSGPDTDELSVREASSVAAALDSVAAVDCVVSEQRLPDGTGLDLLRAVREAHPDIPFVLYPTAAAASETVASEAISAGVTDYHRQDETGPGTLAYRIVEAVDGTRRSVDGADDAEEVAEDTETVLGRVSDAFLALDEAWRFTHLNEHAEELLGVEAETVIGRSVWEEFPEATDRAFYEQYHRAMETQEQVSFTEHYPPLDIWFEVTAYPSETGLSVYFRDVTERVERERELEATRDALEEERAFIESALDAFDDVFYVLDTEGYPIRWNDRAEEVTGYDAANLGEMHVLEFVAEEDHERLEAAIERILGGSVESMETELVTADGDRIPVMVNGAPMTDEDGAVTGIVGSARDITDRKRREQELERFEVLTEEATDVNAVIEADGTFRYLTPSVERVLGYEPEELVGEQAFDYIHPADREEIESVFFDPAEERDRPTRAFRFARADGSWATIEATGRNLLDDPDIDGIVVYTRDITERVERERTLEATAEAFHSLHEAVSDREASFEETVDRLLDLGREYLDVDLGFLNHVEEGVQTVERVRGDHPRLAEGSTTPLDRTYCRWTLAADGHWDVHDAVEAGLADDPAYETFGLGCYVAGVVTVGGERYGTLCFADEESRDPFSEVEAALVDLLAQWVGFELEHRTLESERERLAFLNRLVRHDLLNDLNVVHARAQLLEGKVAESEQPHLDLVRDRTEGMIDLVEAVRSLMGTIVEDPKLEPVDLGTVLREEVESVRRTAEHAAIELVDAPDVAVKADELLGEVFENLLVNAVEHGATGDGRPDPLVEVRVEAEADRVTVHVADDGPGIPEGIQERVFDRGAMAEESSGTGIGLYLVSELVDAYGGTVDVRRQEPGTVVSVTLPRAGATGV